MFSPRIFDSPPSLDLRTAPISRIAKSAAAKGLSIDSSLPLSRLDRSRAQTAQIPRGPITLGGPKSAEIGRHRGLMVVVLKDREVIEEMPITPGLPSARLSLTSPSQAVATSMASPGPNIELLKPAEPSSARRERRLPEQKEYHSAHTQSYCVNTSTLQASLALPGHAALSTPSISYKKSSPRRLQK